MVQAHRDALVLQPHTVGFQHAGRVGGHKGAHGAGMWTGLRHHFGVAARGRHLQPVVSSPGEAGYRHHSVHISQRSSAYKAHHQVPVAQTCQHIEYLVGHAGITGMGHDGGEHAIDIEQEGSTGGAVAKCSYDVGDRMVGGGGHVGRG